MTITGIGISYYFFQHLIFKNVKHKPMEMLWLNAKQLTVFLSKLNCKKPIELYFHM